MKNVNPYQVEINTRDRLLRAWENSMELTRDFQIYSQEIKDNEEAAKMFAKFAENEGVHAAKFRELLLDYQTHNPT